MVQSTKPFASYNLFPITV